MGQNPRSQGERRHRHTDLESRVKTHSEDDLFTILESAGPSPLILILDQVQDPHNLGACLRTAEGAGVQAVIAPKDRSVAVTDVVRTVACGAAERVPFIPVTNLARTMDQLRERGIWIVGTMDKATQSLFEVELTGPIAIALGSEGTGLRRLTADHCDFLVRIPMAGKVESLNVSVAAGVCLYEAVRQRHVGEKPRPKK